MFGARKGEVLSDKEHKAPKGHPIYLYREEEIPPEHAGCGSELFTAFANEKYLASLIKPALETALLKWEDNVQHSWSQIMSKFCLY